ncbi:hypothetical protein [Foetidibacter luteolus]|uniref:hypothetical protein n=1 Tax=Foetidibacter luteolus TaxID=2608880 RepID=UPI00129BAA1A|nr:hypothetical protein [Foetidibacter luteolus]
MIHRCRAIALLTALFFCGLYQPVYGQPVSQSRHFILAPKDTVQQLHFSLPDSSFNKLIDSCSIIFTVKDTVFKKEVFSVLFKPADRVKFLVLPEGVLRPACKMFYQIYWVPGQLLKEPANIALLNTAEQRSFKALAARVQKLKEQKPEEDPFKTGILYSEEYRFINCTISTQPQGAEVYLVPKYEWDFRLRLSHITNESQLTTAVINKLRDNANNYQVPRNTQLKDYGLPEVTYVVILVYNGKYKMIKSFTPSLQNPQNNYIEKSF